MKMLKKTALWFVAVILVMTAIPMYTNAKVIYMPDVTPEMSKASYWSDKMNVSDKVLADRDQIQSINQAVMAEPTTNMNDLIAMAKDSEAQSEILLGICTTRTCVLYKPSFEPECDDPSDPDDDNRYVSAVRVNEPLILKESSLSEDFYQVTTSCVTGWIPKSDVAICEDYMEWTDAWCIDPEDTLVVYDDKIYTEQSNVTPQVSKVELPMGTCLELASDEDTEGEINHRLAYNNHVIWLPTREEDGSYKARLCLIGENRKVSEGYLPLTSANIAMVAMNQLGDVYGWGGMLDSDDCSGYIRNVYKCFGLEMARNTTWQAAQPVKKFNLSGMSDEEKAETIRRLPVGAELLFYGHAMLYLGEENGKLYVISSLGTIGVDGTEVRVRGAVINTLDTTRKDGSKWLRNLHTATVPYLPLGTKKEMSDPEISVEPLPGYTYDGAAKTPAIVVHDNAGTLVQGDEYTVSYSDNINAGTAAVTVSAVEGSKMYTGAVTVPFTISKAAQKLSVTKRTKTVKRSKVIRRKQTVKKVLSVKKTSGKIVYKKAGGSGRLTVNARTGAVTVKKGTRRGSYKIKIRVTAGETANYLPAVKTVTARVRVK